MITLRHDVSGAEMTWVATHDAQFRIPLRPMLLPGLVFIPFEQGLIVDGTQECQVLRSEGAHTWLPELLELLDGRNTLAQIASRMPAMPAGAIANAIALLYSRGLLAEGDGATDPVWRS